MENKGIVAKGTAPTDWVYSTLLVEKPKTKKHRICIQNP